ncbi:MAG TPA: hypothetical protein VGE37_07865 [Archangium sp.]
MRIGSFFARLFNRRSVETTPPASTATTPAPSQPARAPVDTFEPGRPMRVALGQVTGYSATERAKLDQATDLLAKVLNSQEFKDGVLAATFQGKPGFASDTRSPQEIYDVIRRGQENYDPTDDGEVDLNLNLRELGWFKRGVVGYGTEGGDTITTNRRFFSNFTPAEMAGHLAHEWLHKAGFEHDFKPTARRPDSVPYELGDLIEKLAKGPLTPLS